MIAFCRARLWAIRKKILMSNEHSLNHNVLFPTPLHTHNMFVYTRTAVKDVSQYLAGHVPSPLDIVLSGGFNLYIV